MITYLIKENKTISQEIYDTYTKNTPSYKYKCPTCKRSGCMIKHAYYKRQIKIGADSIELKILRVICKECGKTHAVLLYILVPYSQVPVFIQIAIINASKERLLEILYDHPKIDESNARYIRKQYDYYWRERLISENIKFDDCLIKNCFSNYSKQFMQCRNTLNLLYMPPTQNV